MSVARVLAAKQIELERKIKAPCSSSFFFFLTFVFKQDEYVFREAQNCRVKKT
jgi:hypothetical protein